MAFNKPGVSRRIAEKPDGGSGRAASEAAGCSPFPLPKILPRIAPKMSVFDDIRVWRMPSDEVSGVLACGQRSRVREEGEDGEERRRGI